MGRILVFRRKIPPEIEEGVQRLEDVQGGAEGSLNAVAEQANQNSNNLRPPAIDVGGLQNTRTGATLFFQTSPHTTLRLKYIPDRAHPVALAQIFIPLQQAIVECASKPRDVRVERSIMFCSHDVGTCFDYGDYPGGLTREEGFWSYGEAILGLAMVARVATLGRDGRDWRGMLTEVTWVVERNGVEVGLGSLFTNPEFASLQGSLDGML